MSLHANLRPIDQTRAVRAMTAWVTGDKTAMDEVLAEVTDDEEGATGLLLGVMEYAYWVTTHTGPAPEPPPNNPRLS